MGQGIIHDIKIYPLKRLKDERGMVMHMLRNDSPAFKNFGEIYFSYVLSGVVKGWKKHKLMEQNFCVPVGQMQLVFFDDRKDSPTYGNVFELTCGDENYCLVQVPPMIWYSFKAVGNGPSMIANCATLPHDPSESMTTPLGDPQIPYQWVN